MLYLIVAAVAVCLAGFCASAYVKTDKKDKKRGQDEYGHVLGSMWKNYYALEKADRPLKKIEALEEIKTEAKAKRYHWDFYEAATKKVDVEISRNWKLGAELRTQLSKEIEEYNEPIVTYSYKNDRGVRDLIEYVLVNKARLQAGNNKEFHTNTSGQMNGLLNSFIKDDYEYALWSERLNGYNSYKAAAALKECLGDTYPNAAWNEFCSIKNKYWDSRKADLEAFATKYNGKAISLFAKALMFEDRMTKLSRDDAGQDAYKALYADIKEAEKERKSYTSDVDGRIAGTIESFKDQIERLESKDISLSFEDKDIVVSLRNLDNVEISVTPDVKGASPLIKKVVDNPRKSFYVRDTVRLRIPDCDDGDYVVKAKNSKLECNGSYVPKTLSIALRDDSEGQKFYVAEYLTGKPLEKVDLRLKLSGNVVAEVKDVKVDGFTLLPKELTEGLKKDDAYYYLEASCLGADGFLKKSKEQGIDKDYRAPSRRSIREDTFCNIFTDKTAFNPGETVKFKAVLYKGDLRESLKVYGEGQKVVARLTNAENKIIGEKELITNEFGSVAGEFDIPKGERNGKYTLSIYKGTIREAYQTLVVDEFVLPTYDLSFDKVDSLYFVGDTIEVKGTLSSYSGHPLDAANVSFEVDSWGRRIADGEVEVASDGSFSLQFPSVSDRYWYQVTVKVMDATGETQEFRRNVYVLNYINIDISLDNAAVGEVSVSGGRSSCHILSSKEAVVTFTSKNNEGIQVPVPLTYELKDVDDKVLQTGSVQSGETKTITLPGPGRYKLEAKAEVKDRNGKTISSKDHIEILMVGDDDKVLAAKVENVFKLVGSCADGNLLDGESIQVQMGAGRGPVWAVVELFGDICQPLERRLIHLDGVPGKDGSLTTLSFEYKESYPDALYFTIFYFREGTHFTYTKEFRREKTVLNLPLSFTSFKDNTLPGKEYSFTLKSLPETEAVAAIFDKSTETISPNKWSIVKLTDVGARNVFFHVSDGSVDRYGDYYGDVRRNRMFKTRAAGGVLEDAMVMEAPMMKVEESVVMEVDRAPESADNAAAVKAAEEVEVRSDFSTALAFEPFLRTGNDGTATLKFKTSDKLSTFVVQVYAHTKEMKNTLIRQEMKVSIPVKVNLVEPKYLYKGDKYALHATVSSMTDKPVSGTVVVQLYPGSDYKDAKPFATLSKKVTVPAGKTVPVEFQVDPGNHDELGIKAVFADNAKTFSDGMFVSLPVNEAQQTLTEAHSAVLLAGMDKEALIRELRGRFTGTTSAGAEYKEIDVRSMVLDAIPSKVEPSGKDILSLTEAFYVRRVAEKLGAGLEYSMRDENIIERIVSCQNADGGLGWFEGMKSSPVITAVVLERFAKLRDAGLSDEVIDSEKAINYLDHNQFIHNDWPYWSGWLSTAQYAYVRSMYSNVPFKVEKETLSEMTEYAKNYKEFKKYIKDYLIPSEKDGRGLQGQILAKARRIKTLVNMVYGEGGIDLASAWGIKFSADSKMRNSIIADIASLDEYAVEHRDGGWYYPNAVMPWRGLLESEAYAHSLLCDLLSDKRVDSGNETEVKIADGIRIWLMLQKETQKWDDDPAFVDAINSVLSGGEDVLSTRVILLTKTYREPFSKIVAAGNGFTIERRFFKEVLGENSSKNLLEIYPGMKLKRGDKIITEYRIWNQENRSFVKLTAPREAAFRPVNQLSGHVGWWYRPIGSYAISPQGYRNVKVDRTEYYFDVYPEENTTVTEEFFITQEGTFTAPVVTIESLYAPHYRANGKFGGEVKVIE